jgi:hypothetical protein
MIIQRTSPLSGNIHSMDLNVTEEQINAYKNGMLIQDAFPNLTADEREFIMTGITAEEWNTVFAEED